jgi:hypothetical protein
MNLLDWLNATLVEKGIIQSHTPSLYYCNDIWVIAVGWIAVIYGFLLGYSLATYFHHLKKK